MSAEIDRRLALHARQVNSPREIVRRKVRSLIIELNGGTTTIRYGPFEVDIIVQLEKILADRTDADVERALAIMRE